MAYPSVQAMRDALGDIVLMCAYDTAANKSYSLTLDALPAAAQLIVFQWVNSIPNTIPVKHLPEAE